MRTKKIIITGPDGVGKSTLVNYISQNYEYKIHHCTSETPNTFDYHMGLLQSDENTVFDRFNLEETIYSSIYKRGSKIDLKSQKDILDRISLPDCVHIIMYASNFSDLKSRISSRGDTEQVLNNLEIINLYYKIYAELIQAFYPKTILLDISKIEDQIEFFEIIKKEIGIHEKN